MLQHCLATLRREVLTLLRRLSERDAKQARDPKAKTVFLVNNYHSILATLTGRRVASDDTACFEELLAQQREAYVELELRGAFGRLIDFVQRIEARKRDTAVPLDRSNQPIFAPNQKRRIKRVEVRDVNDMENADVLDLLAWEAVLPRHMAWAQFVYHIQVGLSATSRDEA